ncbi:MAG: PQQ-binding-like beta-propeller repeat protein [Candidatus Aminicenantes bacterium]|nr:PQQ-binding-like beta-propeller repeat protein [Candidatus Aminicenantes bacterium]
MKKKIMFLSLFVVLIFSCASCEKNRENRGQEEKAAAQQALQQEKPGTETKEEEYKAPPGSENWPSFRGVRAAGIAQNQDIPLKWDVKKGTNVRWKVPIPGLGHSSPVVWQDRVFITTALGKDERPYLKVGLYGESPDNPENSIHHYRVYCINTKTGQIAWQKTAHSGVPQVKRHIKSSHANCTTATDGKHVVAFFGSEGLYCYNMDGELLWKKDFGYLDAGAFDAPETQWGFGSSPIIYKDRVIVLCDVNNQSFLTALNIEDGSETWRTLRDENPTWGTPTIYEGKDRIQIIVNGYKHIGAYEVNTGKEIWKFKGGGDVPVPTPVIGHGHVFITNGHGRLRPVYAVRLDAEGDISLSEGETSNKFITWFKPKRGAYQPTPIVYGSYLYVIKGNGLLACFEAKTGKELYRERVAGKPGAFTASPVAADGNLYFSDEYGNISIVKAGPQYHCLTTNRMFEVCLASPAISGRTLFIRTSEHLYAIGKDR